MANKTRKQRQPKGASFRRRLAELRKKADVYQMNVERENPDVTKYDRSEEALEHEMPDTRTEWLKQERQPNGLPAPEKEAAVSRQSHRKVLAHAGNALRLARALFASYLSKMPVEAQKSLLAHQAEEFMGLPRESLANALERVAVLEDRYAGGKTAMEPMYGDEEDDGLEDMDMGLGEDLPGMDYSDDEMGMLPDDSELLVCQPADSAPMMAPSLEPEMDLAPEMVEEELAEELPPVEEPMASAGLEDDLVDKIIARLEERMSSRRVKARDLSHWSDSVQDVDTPSEDYHDLDHADYYESGSNSERAEEQWDLSNPIAASLEVLADGETSGSDPGSDIDPWKEEDGEEWSGEDHRSNPAWPMGERFRDQMDVSNPVASSPKSASADALLDFAVQSVASRGLPEQYQPEMPSRRAPAKRVKQASQGEKRGAKTLAGLGRTASAKKKDEIAELSSLWKNSPKIDL